MLKLIELKKDGSGRLANNEPFLLPDALELKFISFGYDMSNVFVSLRNGPIKQYEKLVGDKIIVKDDLLFAGYLNIRVQLYHDGQLSKKWDVFPIKLIETVDGINAFDYLRIIEEKLDKTIEDVNALKIAHEIIR